MVATSAPPSISFIVPTIGRPSLTTALASIETWDSDEVLVVQHTPPAGDYGASERQEGTDKARCDYLAFLDDDNVYVPGHRVLMDRTIRDSRIKNATPVPILFRIQFPNGKRIWSRKWVKNGNVDTQMILVPNDKDMLYAWNTQRRCNDFFFINQWRWSARTIFWCPDVIALMGHDEATPFAV
jgi:glycosyltransferase involved in cell wall biosynthesis